MGIVLGAGGATGLAFHGGVLAALGEATGWDPRRAEILVGTSAGAITASLLRLGLTGSDLRSVSEGIALSAAGAPVADQGLPHRPRSHSASFLRPRPPAELRALLTPWGRSPLALAAALLPAGPVPTDSIAAGLDRSAKGSWPEPALWITALSLRRGRREVFGRPGALEAPLGRAVAASCAIPGFFRPVEIGSERYVDGGVASIHNADLLAGADLDLVVVSAPMAHSGRPALSADVVLRRGIRLQLDAEVRRLRRCGLPVLVLAPTRRVRAAMGLDPMDARRRRLVSRLAHASALAHLRDHELASQLASAVSGRSGTPVP